MIFIFKSTGGKFKVWSEDGHVKYVESHNEIIEFIASLVENDEWELYESTLSVSLAPEIVLRTEGSKFKLK